MGKELHEFEAVLRDPLWAARQSGRPVVAFASNNVPCELIYAAGCFPLQLPTAPRADTTRADRYLEARFDPPVRSALEQLLAGELSDVSLVVLPRTVDSWQRLYYYLCELARSFGEQLPEPFLYDLLHTPFETSAAYNLQSTRLLADKLAALSGRALDDSALAASIALYNGIRGLLSSVAARRHERPCRLSGADALELYTTSQRLDPHALERALTALLGAAVGGEAHGVRTLLAGSPVDSPALHRLIERAGGQVVADFHSRGELLFGPKIREDLPPLAAVSEHYHRHSVSARTFPAPTAALLELAAQSHAEVALFHFYEQEEALTWDYPAQAAALRERGLRTLLLERASYEPDPALEPQLRQFFAEKEHAP
jgi:benzoyl-CoA reductase/2-hydroxyglutaryl-CoA dehydratase subunit BcrC/BadD/HgdB